MFDVTERSWIPPGSVRNFLLDPVVFVPRPALVRRRHRARNHTRPKPAQGVGTASSRREATDAWRQVSCRREATDAWRQVSCISNITDAWRHVSFWLEVTGIYRQVSSRVYTTDA